MDTYNKERHARKHKQRKHKQRKRRKQQKLTKAVLQARAEARAAKRRAARMRTPEDLAAVLGIGRNQAYGLLNERKVRGAIRLEHRWLIPDTIIERIIAGEPGIIVEEPRIDAA